jgi:hypothetical protein
VRSRDRDRHVALLVLGAIDAGKGVILLQPDADAQPGSRIG